MPMVSPELSAVQLGEVVPAYGPPLSPPSAALLRLQGMELVCAIRVARWAVINVLEVATAGAGDAFCAATASRSACGEVI